MCETFVIQVSFKALKYWVLIPVLIKLRYFSIRISKGMKNLNFSSEVPYDFQNLGNETIFIADHKNVKKSTYD